MIWIINRTIAAAAIAAFFAVAAGIGKIVDLAAGRGTVGVWLFAILLCAELWACGSQLSRARVVRRTADEHAARDEYECLVEATQYAAHLLRERTSGKAVAPQRL